ncbi:MAG: rhomboid family intramembrane serine protease [Thaumarchaeota archaeon]|nr:rhomboid family intramembrane serine protease [Nitrososphaerota archaeon]
MIQVVAPRVKSPRFPAATILLILSIIIAFFLEVVYLSSAEIVDLFAFSTNALIAGKLWTLVTALYVHASTAHLLGNMFFLFIFGAALESEVGGKKMLGLFFLGGVLTFLLGVPFYAPNAVLVGASAAIFTLSSAIMLINPTRLTIIILPVGLVAILFFLLNIYYVSTGIGGNVAYISHVIGFLIGIPFGIALSKKWLRNLGITLLMLAVFAVVVFILIRFLLPS